MNFAPLLDAVTARALQTSWLYAELDPVSEFGRRAYSKIVPFRPGHEQAAREYAHGIVELSRRLAQDDIDRMRDALRSSPDPVGAISRAAMGEVLDDTQLLEVLRFLDGARVVDAALIPENIRALASVLERGRAGKFGFYLSDDFDDALAAARADADRAQAEYDSIRGRLAQRVARALGRDEIADAEFIVMRDSVQTLPQGIRVVREAPTYFLCEMELDDAALEALRKRDEAAQALGVAEQAVRRTISEFVRGALDDFDHLLQHLSDLDVRLAQARFARQYECVVPDIVDARCLSFSQGAFLPLKAELEAQGSAYERISIELNDAAVLTGPNMGGKTAALHTCGFIAMLAAFGLPVPAKRATCALFDDIAWLGIGAQEEPGGLLSSFAREVIRLKELLARPACAMIVLVDEFARTTTPQEAKALLVAMVRGLRRRERLVFIATHLPGIAHDAKVRHFAVRGLRDVPKAPSSADLSAALAALADSMDYAVVEVGDESDGQADALALAHLLGLDEDIVVEAKEYLWNR
jgi:DNA mismatch repair protein MutS2